MYKVSLKSSLSFFYLPWKCPRTSVLFSQGGLALDSQLYHQKTNVVVRCNYLEDTLTYYSISL